MVKAKKTTLLAAAGILGAAVLGGGFGVWRGTDATAQIADVDSVKVSTLGDLDNNYRNLVLPVARISAKSVNSTQNGYGIEKMFDNNVGTKWEAKWSGAPAEKVFNFTFTQEETITGFYEITRNDNNIAGTMSTYKIETSADGNTWETAITNGVMPYELGTWNEVFDGAVTTKYLRFTTDAAAISEFRFYYIPSSGEDFQTLKAETEKLRGLVKQGDGFDVYKEDTFQKIGAGLTAAEAMPEETKEEIALKAGAYLDVLTGIKRGVLVQTAKEKDYAQAKKEYQEANTYYISAQVGDQPLCCPQAAKDAFTPLLERAKKVFAAEFVEHGEYLDAVSGLTRGYTVFQRAVIRPQIVSDGFVGENNTNNLMDGLTENRWQIAYNNAANLDGTKWITFDYGSEVKIEGITLSCWWSVKQGIKSFQLEYWDGTAWKPMLAADGTAPANNIFQVENWTNNTNQTEYRTIKMKQQSSSKFRFTPRSIMSGGNNCTIDEFAFNIVTDVAPAMTPGAAAKIGTLEKSGLRFETRIDKQKVDILRSRVGSVYSKVEFGTLIVPKDYLADGTEFTFDGLQAANKKYLDIPSTGFLPSAEQEDYYRYCGSIVNILAGNYTREFVGVGYVRLTLIGGETSYVYAAYDETNARSIYDVAKAAYLDRSETQSEAYPYAIGDTYSRYTEAQLSVLKSYLDGVVNVTVENNTVTYAGGIDAAYYEPPYAGSVEGSICTVVSAEKIKTLVVNGRKLAASRYTLSADGKSVQFQIENGGK